jgi:hypothetical protein
VKRLFSVFFLLLFLFNVGGYYIVFIGLQYRASKELSEKLDNNQYDEDEAFLFKLPLTLPYQITENGYERVRGRFEHGGNFYTLVKQKLENDTLFIVCIHDRTQKRLDGEFLKYAKLSNDIPISQNSITIILLSKLSKDFNMNEILEILSPESCYIKASYASVSSSLLKGDQTVPSPPPKRALG